MKYAFLIGNKVFKVENEPTPITIECPDDVEEGWLYNGTDFTPPPGSLAFARDRKKQYINSTRNVKLSTPVLFNTYYFDSDSVSLSNITAVVSAIGVGIPLPSGFTWRTADNQNVSMDSTQLIMLAGTMLTHVNTQYAISWAKKAALDAATTIEEVEGINW